MAYCQGNKRGERGKWDAGKKRNGRTEAGRLSTYTKLHRHKEHSGKHFVWPPLSWLQALPYNWAVNKRVYLPKSSWGVWWQGRVNKYWEWLCQKQRWTKAQDGGLGEKAVISRDMMVREYQQGLSWRTFFFFPQPASTFSKTWLLCCFVLSILHSNLLNLFSTFKGSLSTKSILSVLVFWPLFLISCSSSS